MYAPSAADGTGGSGCELGTGVQSSAWKMKSSSFVSRIGGRHIGKKRAGGICPDVVYDHRSRAMAFAHPEIVVDFGTRSTGQPRETPQTDCDNAVLQLAGGKMQNSPHTQLGSGAAVRWLNRVD